MATNNYIAASTNHNTVLLRFIVVDTGYLVSDKLSSSVPGYPTFRNKAYNSLFTFVALFSFYFYYYSVRKCLCLWQGATRSFTAYEKAYPVHLQWSILWRHVTSTECSPFGWLERQVRCAVHNVPYEKSLSRMMSGSFTPARLCLVRWMNLVSWVIVRWSWSLIRPVGWWARVGSKANCTQDFNPLKMLFPHSRPKKTACMHRQKRTKSWSSGGLLDFAPIITPFRS